MLNEDLKGWVAPSGKVHIFHHRDVHAMNPHPEYKKSKPDELPAKSYNNQIKQGFARIHQFHHADGTKEHSIDYDTNHEHGATSAHHALKYMKPERGDKIYVGYKETDHPGKAASHINQMHKKDHLKEEKMSLFQSVLREDYGGFIESFDDIMADKIAQALDVFYVTEGRKLLLGKVEEDEKPSKPKLKKADMKKWSIHILTRHEPKPMGHVMAHDEKSARNKMSRAGFDNRFHGVRQVDESMEIEEGRYQGKNDNPKKSSFLNGYTGGNRKIKKALKQSGKEKGTPLSPKTQHYANSQIDRTDNRYGKHVKSNYESENLDEAGLLLKQNRRAKRSDKALQKGAVRGDSTETLKGYRAKTKHLNLDTVNRFRTKSGKEPLGKVSKFRDKINAIKSKNPKRLPEEEFSEDHSLKPSSSQKLARRTRNNEIRKYNELGGAKNSPSNIQQRYRKDIIKSKLTVIKLKRKQESGN
jgi:hypothetical protein